MNVTPEEARTALETVRAITRQTRRSIALGGGGHILIIWGLAWLLGFGGTQILRGPAAGLLWAVVDGVAVVATALVIGRIARHVHDPVGPRVGWLWLALFAYAALWIWIARPASELEVGLLISTIAMFGYVVMGLWLDRTLLWLGLAVTALAVLGALWLPAYFSLWMAIVGGGALIGTGLYVRRRWE